MSNVNAYLKRLKSLRSSVRDKAASDLCVKVLMHECGDDLPAVVNEIKAVSLIPSSLPLIARSKLTNCEISLVRLNNSLLSNIAMFEISNRLEAGIEV